MIALSNHSLSKVALRGGLGVTFVAVNAATGRGMSHGRNAVDWALGLPFDVARPEAGFALRTLRVQPRDHGFVFERSDREA